MEVTYSIIKVPHYQFCKSFSWPYQRYSTLQKTTSIYSSYFIWFVKPDIFVREDFLSSKVSELAGAKENSEKPYIVLRKSRHCSPLVI